MTHGTGPGLTTEELERVARPFLYRHTHLLVCSELDGPVVATFLWHFATKEALLAFAEEVKRRWPTSVVLAGDCPHKICVTDGRVKDAPRWPEDR